jgi:tRNA (cmo5U34)-methyltransferase
MNIPRDWTFKNLEVADAFDAHVREQLPWYELTTGLVAHVARHYIPRNGKVYDIGASTGNVGRAISEVLESRSATLTAIEASPEMCARYSGAGKVVCADAIEYDYKSFDLCVCFLVLMFLTPFQRSQLLKRLQLLTNLGGAILVFDKCAPVGGYPATVMQRLALAGKVSAGATPADVIAKELSLAGAQRPLAPSELPKHAIEVFRFGEFAGWIIEASYPQN